MKHVNFFYKVMMVVATIIVMAITFISCNKEEENGRYISGGTPICYRSIDMGNAMVYLEKSNGAIDSVKEEYTPTIHPQGRIYQFGTTGYELVSDLPLKVGPKDTIIEVYYNDTINRLSVDLGMTVVGPYGTKTIYPIDTLLLTGAYGVMESKADPFLERGMAHYELTTIQGKTISACMQEFVKSAKPIQVVTEVIRQYDTIRDREIVIVHDTVYNYEVLEGDTIWETRVVVEIRPDTIYLNTTDTITITDTVIVTDDSRRFLYTDSVDTHLSVNANGLVNGSTIEWSCSNVRNYVRHYSAVPFTENNAVNYSIIFPYNYTISGTATSAMVGRTVTINNGAADFGGLSVTLTARARRCSVATPLGCTMQLTNATLTSNGVVVSGILEGQNVTATIPVTITDPTPTPTIADIDFPGDVVAAYVTTSHTAYNVTSGEDWIHVLTNNGGTYTWYYAMWQGGLTVSSFEQTTISAAEYTQAIAQIQMGRGLAKVYHHNNGGATFCLGLVQWEVSGSAKRISYYNLTGELENRMDNISSTFSGYNLSNPIKGVLSNGRLSYNGVTYTIQ